MNKEKRESAFFFQCHNFIPSIKKSVHKATSIDELGGDIPSSRWSTVHTRLMPDSVPPASRCAPPGRAQDDGLKETDRRLRSMTGLHC